MRHARFFLKVSLMLFPWGTTNGSLAIRLWGLDHMGERIERRIALVTDYDGPATPSSAAVVLARKILTKDPREPALFRPSAWCRSTSSWLTSTHWESGALEAIIRAGPHVEDHRKKRFSFNEQQAVVEVTPLGRQHLIEAGRSHHHSSS